MGHDNPVWNEGYQAGLAEENLPPRVDYEQGYNAGLDAGVSMGAEHKVKAGLNPLTFDDGFRAGLATQLNSWKMKIIALETEIEEARDEGYQNGLEEALESIAGGRALHTLGIEAKEVLAHGKFLGADAVRNTLQVQWSERVEQAYHAGTKAGALSKRGKDNG